jgi:phthiocerol/phenolphthiocerol synthesis type-I polyketide synthase C
VQLGSYLIAAKWPNSVLAEEPGSVASWLLCCDQPSDRPLAESVGRHLESLGQRVQFSVGSSGLALQDEETFEHVVIFQCLDQEASCQVPDAPLRCDRLRARLNAAAARKWPPRVWILTRGGALVDADSHDWTHHPASGALWGLARVAMNELPQLDLKLIDLQQDLDDPALLDALERELLRPDAEREIILSASGRFGLRMQPKSNTTDYLSREKGQRYRLDFTLPGQLRNLRWQPMMPKMALAADDEVEIEAMAAGLNFRDVMYAMGLLSDEAVENGFAGASLGLEVAGRVSRCGSQVTRFAVGDEVIAFAGASFASHIVVPERAVAAKPAHWSFADAATVPTVFFTVWYALRHLANLQEGERVLIHGGAGGVGIAAIQVARFLGAEIFATAGNHEKRDFVALLGADHVLDSRSLAYADEILALTGGQGVDVVLNSLAGEAIQRNLRALRPFGRFLELGKRDFYENTHIGLRPFKDNISYFGIDADQLMQVRPEYAARIFREVMALFGDGALRPLPHRLFQADSVVDAFRYMQQARQIGKVVLDLSSPPRDIVEAPSKQVFQAKRNATYMVTGGLAGFGLASARWLAERGAGHLALLGRRGLETPGLAQGIKAIESLGAKVHVFACDVTDREQLAGVLEDIRRELPPLRGVLHGAMILDDALLANLDTDRFERVLSPKLTGAWNLHELTLGIPLDFFLLYSSATTFIGNPGQGNYVAANSGLESFASLRQAMGLPATAVCWGAIADVGVLTRNQTAREGLQARLGAAAIPAAQALGMLGKVLEEGNGAVAVMDIDWHTLKRLLPSADNPRFHWLDRHLGQGHRSEAEGDIRAMLAGRSPEDARRIIAEALGAEVAAILRIPADQLDPSRSLYDLGMDSLMAVEMALAVEKRFGVNLPPMAISENPTIGRIAERLSAHLAGTNEAETDMTQDLVTAMAVQHAEVAGEVPLAELAASVKIKMSAGTRLIS